MRGKKAPVRKIRPDELYNSETVSKLINYMMYDGKKQTARKIVYQALEELGTKTKATPVEALEKALENIKPKLEVRARRVGGANYQVPMPVAPARQVALSFRWIIDASRKSRGSKASWESLAGELIAAYKGEGEAIRKRDDMQRMAESNRAFAQFAQ